MFGALADRKAVAQRKEEVTLVAELVEDAGGLAMLHGLAALRLAGLGDGLVF